MRLSVIIQVVFFGAAGRKRGPFVRREVNLIAMKDRFDAM